jgi:hypothetical protein
VLREVRNPQHGACRDGHRPASLKLDTRLRLIEVRRYNLRVLTIEK